MQTQKTETTKGQVHSGEARADGKVPRRAARREFVKIDKTKTGAFIDMQFEKIGREVTFKDGTIVNTVCFIDLNSGECCEMLYDAGIKKSFEDCDVQPGDEIRLEYTGKQDLGSSRSMNTYEIYRF